MSMDLATHKKFKGDRLMPWGKGTVVRGAKGFVFLCGNTATAGDYDPGKQGSPTSRRTWRNSAAAIVVEIVAVAALPD
jgi:hypothetical protein